MIETTLLINQPFALRQRANIEKVVSEAEKRGMDRGEVLSDIERLKFEGLVSKDVVNKICNSLGHPNVGICGRITHDTCCWIPESVG